MVRNTLLFLMVFLVGACSGEGADEGNRSTEGVCRKSCPKTCHDDSDCDSSKGQMCCNYGSYGKACVDAKLCPRFCSSDFDCNTDKGEICCRPLFAAKEKVCLQPQYCIRFCSNNDDCNTDKGEQCCSVTKEPFCHTYCPKTCSTSSDCDSDEVCCTPLKDPYGIFSVAGLCLDPQEAADLCPKKCSTSYDCDTSDGEVCCPDGYCAHFCEKKCFSNAQCDTSQGELCCQIKVIESPFWVK